MEIKTYTSSTSHHERVPRFSDLSDNLVTEIKKHDSFEMFEAYDRNNKPCLTDYNFLHPLLQTLQCCHYYELPFVWNPNIFWYMVCHAISFTWRINHLQFSIQHEDMKFDEPTSPWESLFEDIKMQTRHQVMNMVRKNTKTISKPHPPENLTSFHHPTMVGLSVLGLFNQPLSGRRLSQTVNVDGNPPINSHGGIPSYHVEGTYQEWTWIFRQLQQFLKCADLFFVGNMMTIVEEILRSLESNTNSQFWSNFYKLKQSEPSGNLYVNGWVLALFPYTSNGSKCYFKKKDYRALSTLPSMGMSYYTIQWKEYNDKNSHSNEKYCRLYTGLVGGVCYSNPDQPNHTKALKCDFSWGVISQTEDIHISSTQ